MFHRWITRVRLVCAAVVVFAASASPAAAWAGTASAHAAPKGSAAAEPPLHPSAAEVDRLLVNGGTLVGGLQHDPVSGRTFAIVRVPPLPFSDPTFRLYALEGAEVVDIVETLYPVGGWEIAVAQRRLYLVDSSGRRFFEHDIDTLEHVWDEMTGWDFAPTKVVGFDFDPVSGRMALLLRRTDPFPNPSLWFMYERRNGLFGGGEIPSERGAVKIVPGGDRVLFATDDGTLAVDLNPRAESLLPGADATALTIDNAGQFAYVATGGDGLLKIDLSTETVVASNSSPQLATDAAWLELDEAGDRLLMPDRNGQIAVLDATTLDEIDVIGGLTGVADVAVGPAGTLVAGLSVTCCPGAMTTIVEFDESAPVGPQPTVRAVDSTVAETDPASGEPSPGQAEVQVELELDSASVRWVRATVSLSPLTAMPGTDYLDIGPIDVYFPPGSTTASFPIVLASDDTAEDLETLAIQVTSAVGATVDASAATITVVDDDTVLPVASIVPLDPLGIEGDGSIEFSIELDRSSATDVTVDWSVTGGTAVAGDDFEDVGGRAVVPAGETVVLQSVPVIDNALPEEDETLTIRLDSAVGATVDPAVAVATILDDDVEPPPTPIASIVPMSLSAIEGEDSAPFFIELDRPSDVEVIVDWAVSAGSATAGADFDPAGGTAAFPPGTTLIAQSVGIVDDTVVEADEEFTVALSNATGATVDPSPVAVTIIDDDAPPSVVTAGSNIAVLEGAVGTTREASVVFRFAPPTSGDIELVYALGPGDATPGVDFFEGEHTIVVAAGTSSITIDADILGDALDEPNETFDISVIDATGNAVLGADVTARVTINDDDAVPRLAVSDATADEGTQLMFDVSLSAPSGRDVTVRYTTSRGVGTEAADFTSATATLTFAPGETTKTVAIDTTGDDIDELDELVNLTLSSPANATILDSRGIGTITDDDTTVVTLLGTDVLEGNSGQRSAYVLVQLSSPSERTIRVSIRTVDGTAIGTTALRDYVPLDTDLTVSAGQTAKVVGVRVVGDRRIEGDETFGLLIDDLNNGAQGVGSTAINTIRNDD